MAAMHGDHLAVTHRADSSIDLESSREPAHQDIATTDVPR